MKLIDVGNYLLILFVVGGVTYLANGLKFNVEYFAIGTACFALLKAIILERKIGR